MDYGSIISRAWRITWRYKVLWVLGLFGGASSGLGGSGSGYRGGGTPASSSSTPLLTGAQLNAAVDYLRVHAATIIGVALAVFVVGLVLFILRVAARGGLIREVDEARSEREVRAGAGWAAGFRRWWRIFGIEFLTSLPILILGAIAGGSFVIVLVAAFRRGLGAALILAAVQGGFGASGPSPALAALLLTGAGLLLVLGMIALVLGVILSIVVELALRYAMLQDQGVIASIRLGWHDLWSRRGAFVMWLITVGVGIAYGFALAVVAVVLALPGILLLIAKAWVSGGMALGLAILVLLLPTAVYGTFHSAVWTLFFRRMTGVDGAPVPAAVAPAPTPYAPPAYAPPVYAPPAALVPGPEPTAPTPPDGSDA